MKLEDDADTFAGMMLLIIFGHWLYILITVGFL
jgi:hypothetical protein